MVEIRPSNGPRLGVAVLLMTLVGCFEPAKDVDPDGQATSTGDEGSSGGSQNPGPGTAGPGESGPDTHDPSGGSESTTGDPEGCSPACAADEVCEASTCIPADGDEDGDGVSNQLDCDSNDIDIGATAERSCDTACGTGTQTCTNGEWVACDAPPEVCTPNDTEDEDRSCGYCGTQTRSRTCNADGCGWGEWGEFGSCLDQGPCEPGETQEDTQNCGACDGQQTRTRSCSDRCEWEGWSDWGTCIQCTDPTRPVCNEAKFECDCNPSSCGAGSTCCIAPEGSAEANLCVANGGSCFAVQHCTYDYECLGSEGYECCGEGNTGTCEPVGTFCVD